jgi:hypothetical protein
MPDRFVLVSGTVGDRNNMNKKFNIATGIFPGWNHSKGIMLCGYEWGGGGEETGDSLATEELLTAEAPVVFSNKAPRYGQVANSWPYDRRIIEWFGFWGHQLRRDETGGDFEKCLLQTNWCDTQNVKVTGHYYEKLLADDQVANFIKHIAEFKPRLIFFFGSAMINLLQNAKVLTPFKDVMGNVTQPLEVVTKPFDGKKFKVGFQGFENCRIIALPHPSGSRGLNNEYIKLFTQEIGERIAEVKRFKGIF